MEYSNLFGKTRKTAPSEAETKNHRLLVQAGYIDQLMSGVWSFLPLGWRVHENVADIIREELDRIGAQEVFLPVFQKKNQWEETGRWDDYDPPLFLTEDQHGREIALGPTHEEIITDLARRFIESYKDLPVGLYQIQDKFRNEIRATGGLLRTREFVMKDLYSFHTDKEDSIDYFGKIEEAYHRIFERCGVEAVSSVASGGSIGGSLTREFQVLSDSGEDTVLSCEECDYAINEEVAEGMSECPECSGALEEVSTIEVGHIFNLGLEYSEKMDARYTDEDGEKKLIWMGCYGIGVGRLMATIVEALADKKGLFWPSEVSPFKAHLVDLTGESSLYEELIEEGVDVLTDDRENVSAGEKFHDADLIGVPVRLVVSDKTGDKVEWKGRGEDDVELIEKEELFRRLA